MDTAQWPHQEAMVKGRDERVSKTCSSSLTAATSSSNAHNKLGSTSLERKIRPHKDEAVHCPRCNSTNTKFCYYNNYSLTQPRYFCKTCKRYWTEGGSLRNIPVGGASRKNKRSSSSSSSTCTSPASNKRILSSHHHLISNPNHILTHQPQDLNLGFPPTQLHHDFTSLSQFIQLPTMDTTPPNPSKAGQLPNTNTNTNTSVDHLSALELLNGLTSSRGLLTPFIPAMAVPDPNDNGGYSSGYPSLQDFKPSLNFSLDGIGNGYGSMQGQVQHGSGGGRLLFPFEDLKQAPNDATADHTNCNVNNNNNNNNDEDEQSREENGGYSTTGFWSGMLGAGGSW
ncbi:hypothetical protein vseg_020144 [Gypsophila vaccaria]